MCGYNPAHVLFADAFPQFGCIEDDLQAVSGGHWKGEVMIAVYKSDTGQFVLVHTTLQTVIIDESLGAAFDKMESHIKEHHPNWAGELRPPHEGQQGAVSPTGGKDWASKVALLALVLLPFLWLVTLHSTIGGAVGDVLEGIERRFEKGDAADKTGKQLDELRATISTLNAEVAALKAQPADEAQLLNAAQVEESLGVLSQELAQVKASVEALRSAPPAQP